MHNGNETGPREYRFLSEAHFDTLYATFIEAFSDYVFPFALTESQFRNHVNLNGVDILRTAGCFEGDRLIGFSLNGFGDWNGKRTVYDAGTGVIPEKRRQGISAAMFEMMMPRFQENGVEQCLLEVITTNTPAVSLYEKLDFQTTREVALLQCDDEIKGSAADDLELREMPQPDWPTFSSFWDGQPSWQNSLDAITRCAGLRRIIGAFVDGQCVGYIIFSLNFGRVAQLAVHPEFRKRGIGTALIKSVKQNTDAGYSPQIINIDKSLTEAVEFFQKRGFYERISQFEMLKQM